MTSSSAGPPLVAVAHGSRDPRSAATIRDLVDLTRRAAPETDIRPSFLDLSEPHVSEALGELYATGHRRVVAAPLLLGSAYHARTDLPAIIARTRDHRPRLEVATSDVLGIDPLLESVAVDRLRATGVEPSDPELGIVLAAVGSSHPPANDAVTRMARRWQRRFDTPCVAAFATAASPDVPAAIARLRARGATRIVVASWFLAPGLLPDRVARLAAESDPAVRVAAPLGPDPRVAQVLLDRYSAACEHWQRDTVGYARVSA